MKDFLRTEGGGWGGGKINLNGTSGKFTIEKNFRDTPS